MSSNWVNALDACAAAGVIDYDAPSFISGKKPRYIGHPNFENLPLKNDFLLPQGIKMRNVPTLDTFNQDDSTMVNNPTWKKVLFGIIAGCGIIAGALAIKKVANIKLPKIEIKLPKMREIKIKILKLAKNLGIYKK